MFIGTLFGSIELAMIAFADEQGRPSAAGVLLPLVAVGSGASGLLYGARSWRSPLPRRFGLGLVGLVAGCVPLLLVDGVVPMAVAGLLAGFAISPTLIASFGLVERLVPASAHTEGFTWLNTGLNVGAAGGASLGGWLVDGPGSRAAFGLSLTGAVLALAVTALGRATLSSTPHGRGSTPDGVRPTTAA